MAFSPAKVVSILLAEFGTPEDSSAATREERKVAARFAAILREAVAAAVEVETDECLESDISVDSDWDHCDEHGEDSSGKTNEIDIGKTRVTSDQVCPVY
ncbi:hypothetical protein V3C99_008703, partial [Haemonchus contortus]